jgi:hypothetical protein
MKCKMEIPTIPLHRTRQQRAGEFSAFDPRNISHGDTEMHENEIGTVIVDCAVHLHQALGPGLLVTVYEEELGAHLIIHYLLTEG